MVSMGRSLQDFFYQNVRIAARSWTSYQTEDIQSFLLSDFLYNEALSDWP